MKLSFKKTAAEQINAHNPDSLMVIANIKNEPPVNKISTQTVDQFGIFNGAISATYALPIFPVKTLFEAVFWKRIEVHLTGACLFLGGVAKVMQKLGGNILDITFFSSILLNISYAAYASSKAAVVPLVRFLARELAPINMRVNAIGFALMETPLTKNYIADPAFCENSISAIPIRRLGEPEDLISNILLLLAFGDEFITGQKIYVDGGQTLV